MRPRLQQERRPCCPCLLVLLQLLSLLLLLLLGREEKGTFAGGVDAGGVHGGGQAAEVLGLGMAHVDRPSERRQNAFFLRGGMREGRCEQAEGGML